MSGLVGFPSIWVSQPKYLFGRVLAEDVIAETFVG